MDYLPVLILVAVLVAVGFVILSRRSGEAKADPVAALSAALQQAQEKLHQSVPTRPVPQPAPQIAPQATIPTPVVPPPVAPPVGAVGGIGMPPTPYTGPFYNIAGQPDPLGQYTADTWQRAAREQAQLAVARGTGSIPVASLTDDDKRYLLAMVTKTGDVALPYRVLSGTYPEIATVMQWAAVNGGYQYDPATYSGPLR